MSSAASKTSLLAALISALVLAAVSGCGGRNAETANTPPPVVTRQFAQHLGIPVYPGASPTSAGIETSSPLARVVYAAYYRADAQLPKVKDYYVAHTPRGSLKMYVFQADGGTANFNYQSGGMERQIVLASDQDGTLIALTALRRRP